MGPEDFRGDWEGRFSGTNSGRLYLRLTPVPAGLVAEAKLDDDSTGPAYLLGTGQIQDESLRVELAARDPQVQAQFGTVSVTASFDGQGRLSGNWATSVGTQGQFQASPPTPPPSVALQPPIVSRVGVFEKQSRMPACVVNLDVLKRVHAVLQAAAEQAAEIHERKQYAAIAGGPAELARLYRVCVLVRGAQGEVTVTDDPNTLTADTLPQPLNSVDFEIGLNYRITTGNQASNRALVRFDFTRPPAFDLSNPSGSPTPNNSSLGAFGADTLWVAGIYERVNALLSQTKVGSSWLHRAHTYDVLVLLLGLPLAFSVAVLAASRTPAPPAVEAPVFRAAIAVFSAVLTLVLFRLAFSAIRWLLPYVEYAPSPEPLHRRVRVLLAGVILAVVTGTLGSALWTLLQ